jgi:hypothetical protein
MNKEKKAAITANLKRVLPKSWKYSLTTTSISITLTIKEAPLDLIALSLPCPLYAGRVQSWSNQINPHCLDDRYEGEALSLMRAALNALNTGNWNKIDSMTDCFDVGHYVHFYLGTNDTPFAHATVLAVENARQLREVIATEPKRRSSNILEFKTRNLSKA